ncbi:MAG: pyrroline-5-carboxylate reductase [Candidatus Omnitrophota bacterium]
MNNFKIGIIGCGNMGGAIVRGMVNKGIVEGKNIYLEDKDINKSASLAKETGALDEDLCFLMSKSDIVIIAVKPQDFDHLSEGIVSEVAGQTFISVMAGINIDTIVKKLGREVPVARAMPNMGAFVAEGVTCLSYNSLVNKKEEVRSVFSGIGEVFEVEEGAMNAVTAVSGSGPAYLFYLADAMISAAEKSGLDKDTAAKLVEQTLLGSTMLLKKSGESPGELISKVASRGGTTEAALSVFDAENLKSIIENAIQKAKERSEELSKG